MKKPRYFPNNWLNHWPGAWFDTWRGQAVATYLSLLLATGFSTGAYGLASDADQPIAVEANSAELDDEQNISIYRGDVVVVQGTIKMTGDEMTVHHTAEDELDFMIIEGRQATYRQLPEGGAVYDQAVARRMEYYGQKDRVVLIGEACFKQEDAIIAGERIEYDTALNRVQAFNQTQQADAGQPEERSLGRSRVKLVLKNNKEEEGAAGARAEIPAKLRADCKIIPENPASQ